MGLDFLRCLVPEKIDILGEIWPLLKGLSLHYKCMNFELLLIIAKYWSELFSGRILALYVEYFLYFAVVKSSQIYSIAIAIIL